MDRKSMIFVGFILGFAIAAGGVCAPALAQEGMPPPPGQPVPPPSPDVVVTPPPPQGQWVDTAEYGWVWVPAGTVTYAVGQLPCAYLYTPTYGWTWYASPWGWGRFAVGPWVTRPSPYGHHAWVHGHGGWGWYRGPSVRVHVAPAPHGYTRGYPGYGYGRYPHRGYDGYHRGHHGFHHGHR